MAVIVAAAAVVVVVVVVAVAVAVVVVLVLAVAVVVVVVLCSGSSSRSRRSDKRTSRGSSRGVGLGAGAAARTRCYRCGYLQGLDHRTSFPASSKQLPPLHDFGQGTIDACNFLSEQHDQLPASHHYEGILCISAPVCSSYPLGQFPTTTVGSRRPRRLVKTHR